MILEILLIVIAVSFALFITVGQMKLLYRRHLKSYNFEIVDYLRNHKLTLQEVYSPRKEDWQNAPFKKPQRIKISLFVTTINGMLVIWNDQKYKVIQTNDGKTIWLEIDTTYFKKTKLTFRIVGKLKKSKNKSHHRNVRRVTTSCPACGFHLIETDFECPDCGLNFR